MAGTAGRIVYRLRRSLERQWAPLIAVALVVGLAWVPIPWGLFGMSPAAATTFLGVLWQALAGAVGLSVAVMLFALQSAATTRPVTLTELASRSGLLVVVYLGVAALLDVGVALLPLHHSGANGWPGLLATLVSAVAIASVALVFLTSLRLTDPRVLRRHRIADLRMEARVRVDRSVIGRIASQYMSDKAGELGIELKRWLPFTRHDLVAVDARRDGLIHDIRLRSLRALVATAGTDGPPPVLVTTLGERVSRGAPLMFLPEPLARKSRRSAPRIFVVHRGGQDRDGLRDAVASLHQEALEAIRESRPTQYVEVRDAQEELLLAFPLAWRDAGFAFEDDAESGAFGLTGPVDRVRQNMYEQATRAAASEEREIGFGAAYSPLAVAAKAWELRATTLMSSMLSVSVSIFDSTSRFDMPHFGSLMHENVQRHVLEFLDFHLCRHLDGDEPLVDGDALLRVISLTHAHVASISRINIENRSVELLRSGLRHWRQVLEYATPRDAQQAAAQREVARNRTGCMVAIAAWALRQAMAEPGAEKASVLKVAAGYAGWEAGDDPEIFSTADGVLSEWISREMPERVTYSVDAQTPIARLIAYALLVGGSAPLSASSWVQDRREALTRAVDDVAGASQLWATLGGTDPDATAIDRAKGAIDDAVRRYGAQEAERLRSTPLPAQAVESVRRNVRECWEANRWLPRWLAARGLAEISPSGRPTTRFGIDDLISKSFFLDKRFVGVDRALQDLGRAVAIGERSQVAAALNGASRRRRAGGDLRGQVETACALLQGSGHDPVVFIPINWRVRDELALGFERAGHVNGVDLGHAFAGQINDAPVIELNGLTRIVVADPAAFLQWESWPVEGEDLHVTLTEFDAAEAERHVRSNRKLMRDEEHRSVSDRAARLRTYVWVQAFEGFRIAVSEPDAAVSVTLPAALGRD